MTLWEPKKTIDRRNCDNHFRTIRGLTPQHHAELNIIKTSINAETWNEFAAKLWAKQKELIALINNKEG